MKKRSRHSIPAVCVLLTLVFLFSGCATGTVSNTVTPAGTTEATTAPNEAPKTEAPTEAPTPAPALDPYEVVWYMLDTGVQPDEKLVEDAIGAYFKDKINTTVNIVVPTDFETSLKSAISAGEKVDLAFSCSWANNYINFARDGYSVEITDEMLQTYAPHALEVLKGPFIDGNKVDGKLYNLACNKEMGTSAGALLNKALVDKYNMDISTIKSYADLEPFLKTIKDNEPNVYPTEESPGQMMNCMGNVVDGQFGMIKQPMGSKVLVTDFDIPGIVSLFETAKKYYDAGYIREDALTGGIEITSEMKAGNVFATFVQLKPGKAAEMSVTTQREWVQVDMVDPVVRSSDVGGSMMAIPVTSKDPTRVLMFYDYFYYDRDAVTLMTRGIKDKHYVMVDANTLDYAPETENGTKSGYAPNFNIWTVGNQLINYVFKGEDPNKYTALVEFNKTCVPYESVGFLVQTKDIQNAIDKLKAAGGDTYNQLQFGMAGDVQAAMEKQLKVWNDAGLQDVLAEYNKQYTAWLASK